MLACPSWTEKYHDGNHTSYKESWAQKNWCFWTVVLEKTLESPLNCKEIQPVHPKGNQNPEYSLEGLMLKLKLQYLGHLMRRADSFEKTLMLGKIEGTTGGEDRRWDGWMASLTLWTRVWVDSRSWWSTGRPGVLRFMGSPSVGHDWATKLKAQPVTDFIFFFNWEEARPWIKDGS